MKKMFTKKLLAYMSIAFLITVVFIFMFQTFVTKKNNTNSAVEKLEMVKEKHYDVIFLDHMMPGLDGVETLHHMKEMSVYPCKDTPVIALTANAIVGAREMYLKEGFDDFLSKPIQPEKLEKMKSRKLFRSGQEFL